MVKIPFRDFFIFPKRMKKKEINFFSYINF
mgnify:CR=1 FL=1